MKRKMLFIFNPYSGKAQIKNQLLNIVDTFVKAGYDVTVYPTQGARDAYHKVMEEGAQYDRICCSGGDGTLDETVSGMLKIGLHTPLGYIPAGSTNDFANSLKIPKNMEAAAKVVVDGVPFMCDAGQFNEKNFVYVAAFGLFTDVSYQTSQGLKNIWGHAAYVLEGAKSLSNVEKYHVIVEDEEHLLEGNFIYGMVTNSKFVGGMPNLMGKDVKLDDGLFELTLIREPKNPIELNKILAWFVNQNEECDLVCSFKTRHVTFLFDEETPWTLDGEFGGAYRQIEIKNLQQVIPIMVK